MDDQFIKIEKRLTNLENKIDHIVKVLGIKPLSDENKEQVKVKTEIVMPPPLTRQVPPVAKSQATLNLLPLLAVICFGLAGVFIVKLAIESGWLTPERQWGLLTLFGILLTGVGLLIEKIDKSYRSYAGAAGVIVLYLAAYSSFLYFNIFPAVVAQFLGAVISLFCFYLFKYYQTEFFVVICTIGTYISPIFLNKESDLIYLSGFFLIWAALFSRISITLKSRSLVLLASYFGIGVFTFLNRYPNNHEEILIIILVQSMQFIIFAGGVFYYSIKNKDHLSRSEAISYLPILLFFYGTTYYFLSKYDPQIAPWISLGFAAFIYLLYWQAKKAILNLESQDLVQSFFAVVLFHSGYLQLVPSSGKPWLLPLIILGVYLSEQKKVLRPLSETLKFSFFAMAVIEFCGLCFRLLNESNLYNVIPSLATIFVGLFYYSKSSKVVKEKEGMFLCLIHVLCILALYRIAFDFGTFAVSAAWGIYSLVILIFGYVKKNVVVAKSSLLVLTVTCLKALVYDAAQTSSGMRIASLILTGAILYGAGHLFQKINKWDNYKE